MSKQSLLLVDGDTRSLRVLEVSLRKAGFTVTTAVSVEDALDKLELDAPDLIISETTFPDGDGFELRRRVRATPDWGEIPFIFLTAENAIENKIRGLELGVDDYLTKPIYIKEIITRINILLQKRQRTRFEERRDGRTRFAGRVGDMPVVDVIQTIEISRKSGVIQFVGSGGRQAAIYFRDGRVIDAEAGALQGGDAVYRLLTWNEGEFEVSFRTVRRREAITMSSQGLLMEGMRRLDEWSRLLEQLPALQHRFDIDAGELASRLGDVPDDHNRILRMIDGKRTLLEVIDASDVGDLECLQAISRLYFEELLIDLDHAASVKRDTGRPMAAVDLDAPTPIEDAASGPVRARSADVAAALAAAEAAMGAAAEASRGAAASPAAASGDDAAFEEVQFEEAQEEEEEEEESSEPGMEESLPGALMGGYRPSSLRLIDEAVAAAQAIEPFLFDDLEDAPRVNGAPAGNGVPAAVENTSSSGAVAAAVAAAPTGPVARPGGARLTGVPAGVESRPAAPGGAAAPPPVPAEEVRFTIEPRAGRPGTARPASKTAPLALGAAAAKAAPASRPSGMISGELPERSRAAVAAAPDSSIVIEATEPRPALSRSVTDPGLRMIGSLGRDRAEASGELVPLGAAAPGPGETQRELVTILPRRITREMQAVTVPPGLESEAAPASAPPPAPARTRPATVPPGAEGAGAPAGTPPPVPARARSATVPPEGARARSATVPPEGARARSATMPPEGSRPRSVTVPPELARPRPMTLGPLVLIVLAAALAGTAVYLRLRRTEPVTEPVIGPIAARADAVADGSAPVPTDGKPSIFSLTDAPDIPDAPPDAVAPDAAPPDARGPDPAAEEKAAQAKALLEQANDAIAEGSFERALRAADGSLALKKSPRAYLARAKALQRLERVDEALTAIAAAERMAPKFASVFEMRGRILWGVRRKEEARQQFELFLQLEPDGARAAQIRKLLAEPH